MFDKERLIMCKPNIAKLVKRGTTLILAIALLGMAVIPSVSAAENGPLTPTSGPRSHLRNGLSTNWSGYAALTNLANPQSNSVSDVKGQWIVPAVSCTRTASYSSTWVGIDGYSDNTVEQIGTDSDCYRGQPRYYAWFEMYPQYSRTIGINVKAGDSISTDVNYTGNGNYVLSITDSRTNVTFKTTQRGSRALRQSAEWIVEAPSSWQGVLPLANFGTESITNAQATINGVTGTVNNNAWQNDPITMINTSGQPKAAPSTLSPDGSSFSVAWASS
jgi:hypothetical protein